jgi:VWFA-related protein
MRKIAATILAIAILAPGVVMQTPPQKPQEIAPDDIVRISTTLVQTDVVVTDKNDKVITDLKLDDFKVFENGKRQDVKVMEYVSDAGTPRLEGDLKVAGQSVEPDIVRNLTATELRRVFAFVVDDLTIPIEDVFSVRKLLTDFVDNQMRDGDLVAIVRVVGGNGLLQQFTSDKRLLRRAIAQIAPTVNAYSAFNNLPEAGKLSTDLMAAAEADGAPFPSGAISAANTNIDASNDESIRAFRSLVTLTTAGEVIGSMKSLPGRKSVVLISGGLPLAETTQNQITVGGTPITVLESRAYLGNANYLLRQLVDRASRSGVVINTLDIRGLNATRGVSRFTDPGNEATSAVSVTGGRGGAFGRQPNMAEFDNFALDTMSGRMGLQALAQSTGGVSVVNTNSFREGLDRIVERSSYYLLAYSPTEEFDGKFHKLEIKVNRPGVHVYSREGYFAKAELRDAGPLSREDAIVKAAMSPLAKREVELAGRLQYRFLPENKAQFDINVLINANNLTFKQDPSGSYKATFDVVGFLINSLGKTQAGFNQIVQATLSPEEYKQAQASGISYTGHAELTQGTYQLRVVVRDAESGRLGSLMQYVEVPDLSKKRLTASSLFLYAVNPAPGSKPEPLTALRQLARKNDLRYAAIIYNPKLSGGQQAQLRSQLVVSRGGKIIYEEPEAPLNAAVQDGQVIKIGQLGLGKAAAGRYVLTLVITDPQADKQARTIVRSIDFSLTD